LRTGAASGHDAHHRQSRTPAGCDMRTCFRQSRGLRGGTRARPPTRSSSAPAGAGRSDRRHRTGPLWDWADRESTRQRDALSARSTRRRRLHDARTRLPDLRAIRASTRPAGFRSWRIQVRRHGRRVQRRLSSRAVGAGQSGATRPAARVAACSGVRSPRPPLGPSGCGRPVRSVYGFGGGSSSACEELSRLPVIAALNSPIPRPRARAVSGRRLGPKIKSGTISMGPMCAGVSRPVGIFSAVDARLDHAGVVEEVRAGVGAVAGDVGVEVGTEF
jgi:hypothetical protein